MPLTAAVSMFILIIGLRDKLRVEVQNQWVGGKYRVIAATISFGMGVDKPTVR